uniref:Uncharacterized protein n=1 Tax=Ditylenchus dipsaci TaxID=166011 RepID=A0A915DJL6_9BILA
MYLQRNKCARNTAFYLPILLVLLSLVIKPLTAQYYGNSWIASTNSSTSAAKKDELKLKIACLAYGYCNPSSTDFTNNYFGNYLFGGNTGYPGYYGGGSAYTSPYTSYYYNPYGSNIAGQNGYNPFGNSIVQQGYGYDQGYGSYGGYGQGYGGYGYGYGKK